MRVAQRSGQQDAYFYRLSTTGFLEWTVYNVIDPLTRIWADGAAPLTDVIRLRDPAPSLRLINESHNRASGRFFQAGWNGEQCDLPSRDFNALWAQIAGPLMSRKGWLNKVDLNTFLDMVNHVDPLISDVAARESLVDLEMVFRTAIARGHDVLVLAD